MDWGVRMGRQMSLMLKPMSWGTVLCLMISMASLMQRGYQCLMLVVSVAWPQLIWWSPVWECLIMDDINFSLPAMGSVFIESGG